MPLRCYDPVLGNWLHAFDLSPEQWRDLEVRNRRGRHLQMPCCSAQVTLRRSRRGTQFFAHKSVGQCTTAPETEAHLRLKQLVVETARECGWEAETEVGGLSPSGGPWRADVLAVRRKARVAFEIQWSSQTDEETWRRQQRYEESGIRCLWLLRQPVFAVCEKLPAVQLRGTPDEGFTVCVPDSDSQSFSIDTFLHAVFTRRFRYGIPLSTRIRGAISTAIKDCWRCGAESKVIVWVRLAAGTHSARFSVPDLSDHPGLFEKIKPNCPDEIWAGVKWRYSHTLRTRYLSNGCVHCDALFGEFFEHENWYNDALSCQFEVEADECWIAAFGFRGWGVFE
jgi:hypothetical protein